jgi:hypothetical protein
MIGCRERVVTLKRNSPSMTQTDIAKQVGVTKERVRQLLNKEGLNNVSQIREQKRLSRTCIQCGEIRPNDNSKYCSRLCHRMAHRTIVYCSFCGAAKSRMLSETKVYEGNKNKHKHFFCSRHC